MFFDMPVCTVHLVLLTILCAQVKLEKRQGGIGRIRKVDLAVPLEEKGEEKLLEIAAALCIEASLTAGRAVLIGSIRGACTAV